MDRSFKAFDLVHVYQSDKRGELLATFRQQPYAHRGFDNYMYRGRMYAGFKDLGTDKVYILLTEPLQKPS